MGGGSIFSSIFGGGQSSPSVPEYKPVPVRENEAEAEAKTVRDEESRKIRARRAMGGTVLTSPLGVDNNFTGSGVLGASLTEK